MPGTDAARIWGLLHADADSIDLAVWRTAGDHATPGRHVVRGLFGALVPDADLARVALIRAYGDASLVTVQAVAAFQAFRAAEAARARSGQDGPGGPEAETRSGCDPLFAEVPGVIEQALIRAALEAVRRYQAGPWPAAAAYLRHLVAYLDGGAAPAAQVTAEEARAAGLAGRQVSIARAIGVTDAGTVAQVEQLMLHVDDPGGLDPTEFAALAIEMYAGLLAMTGDGRAAWATPTGTTSGQGDLALDKSTA